MSTGDTLVERGCRVNTLALNPSGREAKLVGACAPMPTTAAAATPAVAAPSFIPPDASPMRRESAADAHADLLLDGSRGLLDCLDPA